MKEEYINGYAILDKSCNFYPSSVCYTRDYSACELWEDGHMIRSSILFTGLLFVGLALSNEVRASDLVISGAVTEVKVVRLLKAVKPVIGASEGVTYEKAAPFFEVFLRLTYCNKGEAPLIVPLRQAFPSERTKITFLDIPSPTGAEVASVYARSNGFTRSFPERLLSALRFERPVSTFKVIEPTQCFESFDFVQLDSGYEIVLEKREKNRPDIEVAKPKYPYFKLQYSYSLADTLPVADARRRWSGIGKLVTRSDSDFLFETGVIINKLPE